MTEPVTQSLPAWHLGTADALARICQHAKIEADRARLIAGLPLVEADLPPRTVPIAAARVGLGAEIVKKSAKQLKAADLPCLVILKSNKVALVRAVEGDKAKLEEDETIELKTLAAHATGEIIRFQILSEESLETEETGESSAWKALAQRFALRKGLWLQLMTAGLIINITALVLPLFLMAVYDRVVPNQALETLWALGIGVLIAIVFEFSLKLVRQNLVETVSLRISTELQHLAADRTLRADLEEAPRYAGAAFSGLKETDAITNVIPSAILAVLIDLPFFLLILGLIYSIGGPVAFAPLFGALALLALGVVSNIGLAGASKAGVRYQEARQNLLTDILEGLAYIKSSLAEGQFLRHWDVISDQAAISSKKVRFWAMIPVHGAATIMQLVTIGVIVIGVLQLIAGNLSVGGMVACTLLSNRAMVPVSQMISLAGRALQSLASFKSVFYLLGLKPERSHSAAGVAGAQLRGEVRAVGVRYAYPGQARGSLDGLDFHIPAGSRIALVGKSGAGKTTLLNLIAGLYTPSEGDLFIDGFNVRQYGANDLRRHIGFAPQSARLFDFSLKDNICLGLNSVNGEHLANALNISGVSQFAAAHPEGLAMKLGPNGEKLSGGQRQAVLLARALAANPSILLLDEPTSAMDSTAEQRVINGLSQVMDGRTTIISTHRTPLLKLVDRIIWLEDGQIKLDKPRDEVLEILSGKGSAQSAAR